MRTIPIQPYVPAAKRDEAPVPEAGPLKGRGTAWTIEHRYARQSSELEDDGWGNLEQQASEERVAPRRTCADPGLERPWNGKRRELAGNV